MAPTPVKKNPLDLIKSGTGGVPVGRKRPTGSANQDILNRKLSAILGSNAPESYKAKAIKQSPDVKQEEPGWVKALNLIGKPKTLVVASLRRAIDPNANWAKDVSENIGFGKIIEGLPLPEVPYATDFVRGALGFAGDVALDPLTYLGVGLADDVLKAGGKAPRLLAEASKFSQQIGKTDDAAKFAVAAQKATKGLSRLNTSERKVVQELAASEAARTGTKAAAASAALKPSGGLYFNIPGTGRITNYARSTVGMKAVDKKQLKLLGQSETLSAIPRGVRNTEEFLRKGALGQSLGKYLTTEGKRDFYQLARRSNDPAKITDGILGIQIINRAPATEIKFVRDATTAFTKMIDDLDNAGVEYADVTRAAGGDTNAFNRVAAKLGPERAVDAQEFSRNIGRLYNEVLGVADGEVGSLPIRDLHAATMRTEELKAALNSGSGDTYNLPGATGKAGFEQKALAPGDTFLDAKLVDPSEHPNNLSIPDQMENAAKEFYGDEYVTMFNQDFKEATKAQIRAMGRRIRSASVEKGLRDYGIAKDLFETVQTAAAAQAKSKLRSVLDQLPQARQANAESYLEVENAQQAFDAAEVIVAGSKQQAQVLRAEARIDRLAKTLLGEDSSDPVIKGLYTKLKNVKSSEEALRAVAQIEDEVLRQFPDEADQILAPLRQVVRQSELEFGEAAGRQKKFQKLLTELEENRAKVVAYNDARSARIREFADLIIKQRNLRNITQRIMGEIADPLKYGAAEREALTRDMQLTAKGLNTRLEATKTMRALLEAPELMTGPSRGGALKSSSVIDEKTGRVASTGMVRTSTVGQNALGGDADLALLYFLEHPDLDQSAVGLKKLIGQSVNLEDLNNRQIAAIIKEANRITDDLQRQVETVNSALQRRIDVSPQMGLKQAQAELDRVSARLVELGQDEYVAYLGDLKVRLPEVGEDGLLVKPLVSEEIETALVNAAYKHFAGGVEDIPKNVSIEGMVDNYLFDRADEIYWRASGNGELDQVDPEILDQINTLRDDLEDVFQESVENRNMDVYSLDEDAPNSVRTLNELLEEVVPLTTREISNGPDGMPWGGSGFYHGGSTAMSMDLTQNFGGSQFANADSVAGTHWTVSSPVSQGYAKNAVSSKGGQELVVKAQLGPKNTLIYGPHEVDLIVGSVVNFDVLPRGHWTHGRARYSGDVMRNAVENGVISRSILDRPDITSEQKLFWNTVFDAFDESNDAADALRKGASLWKDDKTLMTRLRMEGGYFEIEGYDDQLVDYIARSYYAAGAPKNEHGLLQRGTNQNIIDSSLSFNETLKAMGYDSIGYAHAEKEGWAIIAIDPAIIKIYNAEVMPEAATRVRQMKVPETVTKEIEILSPKGTVLAKPTVKGRKTVAFDLHDANEEVTKAMFARQDEVIAKIDDAAKKVGTTLDTATADWKNADINLQRDRAALATAEANAGQKFDDLISARYGSYSDEVTLRGKAVRYGELIEQRQAMLQAEMASAEAQGVAANTALDDLRSELGVLQLERDLATAQADLAASGHKVMTLEQAAAKFREAGAETEIINVLENGFKRLGMGTQAPDYVVDAIAAMTKIRDPKEIGAFMKTFDWLTQAFKSWAIATPGFHARNFMGGVFNNFLAGVELTSYKQFRRADRLFQSTLEKGLGREEAYAAIGRKYGELIQEAYEISERSYAFGMPGQIGSTGVESGIGDATNSSAWRAMRTKGTRSFIIDNPATRLNLNVSERVERQLRGTLAFDQALKGANSDEILSAVYKFHFNYDDLSSFEAGTAKRLMPFYTWTRKNIPLQIEMMFAKPQYYANIGFFKQEMEQFSEQESLVPAWFNNTLNIRMPFKNPMGEQMYMMPQLPPTDLMKLRNPRDFLGMLNPLVKVPVEAITQKKLYNDVPFKEGQVAVPDAWNKLGIGSLLEMTGRATRDQKGNIVARDSDLYAIESFLPLLGRARRLFPSDSAESEKKYSSRVVLSWANAVFGLGLTANTESDMSSELYRRTKNLDKINKELSTMGYGGYKTLTRDIASKRKPVKGEKSPYLIVATPKGGANKNYVLPKKGESGSDALTVALRRMKFQNISPDLQQTIENLQKARKK
jgi:hypothetical protein